MEDWTVSSATTVDAGVQNWTAPSNGHHVDSFQILPELIARGEGPGVARLQRKKSPDAAEGEGHDTAPPAAPPLAPSPGDIAPPTPEANPPAITGDAPQPVEADAAETATILPSNATPPASPPAPLVPPAAAGPAVPTDDAAPGSPPRNAEAAAALDATQEAFPDAPLAAGGPVAASAPPPVESAIAEIEVGPETPNLALAAEQLTALAEAEKGALQAQVHAHRAEIQQAVDARVQSIATATEERVQAVAATIDARKSQFLQDVEAAKAAIVADANEKKVLVQAEGDASIEGLQKDVDARRQAALTASEDEAQQAEQAGETEGDRAKASAAASIGRLNAVATTKAAEKSKDASVAGDVRKAVFEAARNMASDIQKGTKDLVGATLKTAGKAAQQLREAGRTLAESISEKTADAAQSIRQGIQSTIDGISSAVQQRMQSLAALGEQVLSSLDKLKAESIPAIRQAGEASQVSARAAGDAAAAQAETVAGEAAGQFDVVVNQVVAQVRDAGGGSDISPADVGKVVQLAGDQLRQLKTEIVSGVQKTVETARDHVNSLIDEAISRLLDAERKVSEQAGGILTQGAGALGAAKDEIGTFVSQQVAGCKTAAQGAIQQLGEQLDTKVDEAKGAWSKERGKLQSDLRSNVDQGIKENDAAEQKAPAELAKVATNAASDSFSFDWWGALKAVGDVVLGLVVTFALAGIIAFVLGISLAAALIIVLVGFVAWRYWERLQEIMKALPPDSPWYINFLAGVAALGAAILDITGIGFIYEGLTDKNLVTGEKLNQNDEDRTRKVVGGVLNLIILLVGAARAMKGPAKAPVETPETGPVPKKAVPKPNEAPPVGLSPKLQAIRSALTDPRAIEQFDTMFQRLKGDSAKMEKILDGFGKDAEQRLIKDWEASHGTPKGAALDQVGPLKARAEALRAEIEAFRSSNPKIEGLNKMLKSLEGEITRLESMERGQVEATVDGVKGTRANIDGVEAEFRRAQSGSDVTGVNKQFSLDGRKGAVEVDVIEDGGKGWVDVKNVEPFGLESSDWTGAAGKQGLKLQAQEMVRAASQNPTPDGKTPTVKIQFPKGVSRAVASELAKMGIKVEGKIVDPIQPVPVPAPIPNDDRNDQ